MRLLVLLLLFIGTGAGLAGHIFIAWGLWIAMFVVARQIGRHREYWCERRRLRDAYYRAYLRNNGYQW